jgi:beta-glucosidase
VDVRNTGRRAGAEVVQLYTHQRTSRDKMPVKQLKAFQKVTLNPGQTRTVRLSVPVADLAHWDVTRNRWVVESSAYDLLVGASSGDIRARATVRVRGERIPARNLSVPTRAENFDGYTGIRLVDQTKTRGTAVAATGAGGWIKFTDANLGRRATTFTASAANAVTGTGTIQIRLDSPTGRLAGTATIPATGDVYTYTTTTTPLTGATGNRDVYLIISPDLRLATFSIT